MFRRLIPDSIAGRTLVILLLGLTVSHFLSLAFYFTDRTSALLSSGGEHLAERIATISRIVEKTPPADRPRVVALADDPNLRVEWSEASHIGSEAAAEATGSVFHRAMHDHLPHLPHRQFRAAPHQARAAPDDPAEMLDGAETFHVSLQLSDGSWLNFTGPGERPEPLWSIRLVLSMAVMVAAVVGLSAVVVYHSVAPLHTFAGAAVRLGLDVGAPPLPETGPREVRSATRAFNEMQGRIRRFVEDRTQMLAAISHDLRTPIMRLRLRAEFIDDEEQRSRTLADLAEMERMINSTLAFARNEAADELRETVDLTALVQRAVDSVEDAGLEVTFTGGERVAYACRPQSLRRALTNLIENAAVYGRRARVHLEVQDRSLVVRIDDDGPGIPEDQRERVFDPFYRLEQSRSRETGGTGLGLTVARTIVRAHGGGIRLGGRAEGGLRVEVVLPR